jgi:hypothetical protein
MTPNEHSSEMSERHAHAEAAYERREEQIIRGPPEKYRRRIRDEHDLMDLLRRAYAVRDQRVAAGYGSAAARANGSS